MGRIIDRRKNSNVIAVLITTDPVCYRPGSIDLT